MDEVYLMFTDADANHNKFYRMIDVGNGKFEVVYGRVGNSGVKKSYPISEWSKKYREKINKGYTDISSVKAIKNSDFVTGQGSDLINELITFSKFHLSHSYSNLAGVSIGQIKEAERIIDGLSGYADKNLQDSFNEQLIELFNKLPRSMGKVSDYIASNNSTSEMYKIINRERTLLDNVRSYISLSSVGTAKTVADLGLIIESVTKSELEAILDHCCNSLKPKVRRAWKVTNVNTQKEFDNYCKKNNITKQKMLWHGSGNENWLSILETGLKIRPAGAVYTGSMFGDGLYFATDSGKSFNYTSYRGTYWRGGTSDVAYMAVFNTAIGNSYDVYAHTSELSRMNQKKLNKKGYNSLFAHKGQSLQRDEIVFYNPSAVTIAYLVEFR